MMKKPPPQHRGFARLRFALIYSLNGLRTAFRRDAAFRQEVFVYALLMAGLCFLPLSAAFKAILFSASTMVLVAELLNSAVESVVNTVTPGYDERAKQAKDLASAAVFVSIVLAGTLWCWAGFRLILRLRA